jgi:hypothetical protein
MKVLHGIGNSGISCTRIHFWFSTSPSRTRLQPLFIYISASPLLAFVCSPVSGCLYLLFDSPSRDWVCLARCESLSFRLLMRSNFEGIESKVTNVLDVPRGRF